MGNISTFTSRHFNLEQLADGVYAAIHAEEGWAICNAGIIDLGDRTLVFDSFMSPQAARPQPLQKHSPVALSTW